MKCPKCQHSMNENLVNQRILIDVCSHCRGIWLDQGEILHFIRSRKLLDEFRRRGLVDCHHTRLHCPRCTPQPLFSGTIPGLILHVEACNSCKGMFFDAGELQALNRLVEGGITPQKGASTPPLKRFPRAVARFLAPTASLPNLAMTSLLTLAGLYAMLAALLILLAETEVIGRTVAVVVAIGFIVVQFVLSPWILDLSLRFLGSLRWVGLESLPQATQVMIREQCAAAKIPVPRLGIIDDGAPNAFTYGRTRSDARLVITRGLTQVLSPDELHAVIAHELGHIVHWDFLVMTLAQMIPILLYQIYRICRPARGSGSSGGSQKGAGYIVAIAAVAYFFYVVSRYAVLYLSRVREYWADRYAARAVGDPDILSSALIKVAYGLARTESGNAESQSNEKQKAKPGHEALLALSFSDLPGSRLVSLYAAQGARMGDEDTAEGTETSFQAMKWDLWNPWAFFHELHSTHPLIAKRVKAMTVLASSMGKTSRFDFPLEPPESYWDEFLTDLFFAYLPFFGIIVGGMVPFAIAWSGHDGGLSTLSIPASVWQGVVAGFAAGFLGRVAFSYPAGTHARYSVAGLLKIVKVSGVRGVPCCVRGRIIGRGIPGYVLSEDFVMEDKTGRVFLDYEQPLAIFNLLFAVFRARSMQGQTVEVEGWYRRAPMPFIEILHVRDEHGRTRTCHALTAKIVFALVLLLGAILLPRFLA